MDKCELDVYQLESIIDSRKNTGVVKYRVRWVRLDNCPLQLQQLCERFSNKPLNPRNM